MNVLVDTSAWSLLLRRRSSEDAPELPVARTLRQLILGEERVFLTGIVYQEILQGVRVERQRREMVRQLQPFPLLEATRATYERAARLRDRCLTKGVTPSTIDVLIAQVAIDGGCVLLTADSDFNAISAHSSLRLLRT